MELQYNWHDTWPMGQPSGYYRFSQWPTVFVAYWMLWNIPYFRFKFCIWDVFFKSWRILNVLTQTGTTTIRPIQHNTRLQYIIQLHTPTPTQTLYLIWPLLMIPTHHIMKLFAVSWQRMTTSINTIYAMGLCFSDMSWLCYTSHRILHLPSMSFQTVLHAIGQASHATPAIDSSKISHSAIWLVL